MAFQELLDQECQNNSEDEQKRASIHQRLRLRDGKMVFQELLDQENQNNSEDEQKRASIHHFKTNRQVGPQKRDRGKIQMKSTQPPNQTNDTLNL